MASSALPARTSCRPQCVCAVLFVELSLYSCGFLLGWPLLDVIKLSLWTQCGSCRLICLSSERAAVFLQLLYFRMFLERQPFASVPRTPARTSPQAHSPKSQKISKQASESKTIQDPEIFCERVLVAALEAGPHSSSLLGCPDLGRRSCCQAAASGKRR